MAVVAITMLVAGCGSSGAWSPEKKAELVEACIEPPALEEMTGLKTTDDMLRHIFERFCIGK